MEPIGPTSMELATAGLAAGLVVLLAAALYVRSASAGVTASPWARMAATATAAIGLGSLLVATVLWGAAERARRFGEPPYVATEPFASLLIDVRTTVAILPGDRARYATVVLLPVAIAATVLAAGLVRDAASATVRLVTAALAGVGLAAAAAATAGEPGRLVAGVALALGVLALVTVAGLAVDQLVGVRPASPARSPASPPSPPPSYSSR